MRNDIYLNEIERSINTYKKYDKKKKKKIRKFDNFFVVSDNTIIEDVLIPFLLKLNKNTYLMYLNNNGEKHEMVEEQLSGVQNIDYSNFNFYDYNNTCFIFLIDTDIKNPKWLDLIKQFGIVNENNNYLIIGEIVPKIPDIPNNIQTLAEREYSYYIENYDYDRNAFFVELEKTLRRTAGRYENKDNTETNDNITVLRFDNLYGSTGVLFKSFDLAELLDNIFNKKKEATVSNDDYTNIFTFMYVPYAVVCIFVAATRLKKAHIYNVNNESISIADIKNSLKKMFPDYVAIKSESINYKQKDIIYHKLSSTKFLHETGVNKFFDIKFANSFYLSCCSLCNIEYDVNRDLKIYQGKLQRLKDEEMEMLAEIQRICKKHNINYFLTAGSLLGAIRNNKSIDWDDDLDLGMLREDFEKFRQVVPEELNKKYHYSSWITDPNVHYYFDKIRLNDTYFSTFYSNEFILKDGVFVDFIIYDQTANTKMGFAIHSFMMRLAYYMLSLKWINRIPKKHKRVATYMLPFLKRINFNFLHKFYDYVAKFYFNDRHKKYLIDGGTKKKYGPFPRDYLTELEWTDFDGVKVPVPVRSHEFLSFFYGPDYKELPPMSKRVQAHKIARLDLGKYLIDNNPESDFREVDIHGELYEEE